MTASPSSGQNFRQMLAGSWGLALRELRGSAATLWLPIACTALALVASTSVGFLSSQVEHELTRDARAAAGGDIEITTPRVLTEEENRIVQAAIPPGSKYAQSREFVSMARDPKTGRNRIVEVRAVSEDFPLYGQFELEPESQSIAAVSNPTQATIFARPELGPQLGVKPGDIVQLGQTSFKLAAWVKREPGLSASAFALGPKVWIALKRLPETGLDRTGSRIRVRNLVRLPVQASADRIAKVLKERLPEHQIHTSIEANSQLRDFYKRLLSFLEILVLLVIMISGLGVLTAVRHHIHLRRPSVAILRTLGASQRQIYSVYINQLVLVGLVGSTLGVLGGLAFRSVLPNLLGDFLRLTEIIPPSPWVILGNIALGVGITFCFGMISLIELPAFRPIELLRRMDLPAPALLVPRLTWSGLTIALFFGLSALWLPSLTSAALFIVSLGGAGLTLWAIALFTLRRLSRASTERLPFSLGYGLRALSSSARESALVVSVLALGMLILSSLAYLRVSVLTDLSFDPKSNRPQLFLIDIGDDQKTAIEALLKRPGVQASTWAKWIKSSLVSVNGEVFKPPKEGGFRGREMNLSERLELYPTEKIVEGTIWKTRFQEGSVAEVSVERGFAERMDLHRGDALHFEIQGVPLDARITSVRTVKWSEFQPNFFLLFQEGALSEAPKSWIATVSAPDAVTRTQLQEDLLAKFPNVTAVDISELTARITGIAGKVSEAMSLLSLFAIAVGAGIVAMIALENSRRRSSEIALLKCLGASRRQLLAGVSAEYLALALTSSLLGAGGGYLFIRILLRASLRIAPPGALQPEVFRLAASLAAIVVLTATLSSLRVFSIKPLSVLKSE